MIFFIFRLIWHCFSAATVFCSFNSEEEWPNIVVAGCGFEISPTVDCLFPFPAFTIMAEMTAIEANFGDYPAKPFEYDIHNCPGLEMACI
jgi:hypothetical protein